MQLIKIVYQVLSLLLFLTYAAADGNNNFAINSPIESTTWNGGKSVTITWYVIKEVPDSAQVTFTLVQGESSNLKKIAALGTASINAKQLTVQLPNYSSGTDYVIKAEAQGQTNYSHYFTIAADPNARIESAGAAAKPTEVKDKKTENASASKSSTSQSMSSSSPSSSSASSSKTSNNSTSTAAKKSDSSRIPSTNYFFTIASILLACSLLR